MSIHPTPTDQKWTGLEKNSFRFFFIFLSATSLFAYNILFQILRLRQADAQKIYGVLGRPVEWIDNHFFHIGYNPARHFPLFADGHFGWVLLVTLFILSVAGTVFWALADRNRADYSRLQFWFHTYLAYYLFIPLMGYGLEKIMLVQMPYPNIMSLLSPLAQKEKSGMVWDFIGISPVYSIFTGLCELAGAFLILFRRTRVFGSLFVTTVLTNVVCFNLMYNIQVKILCMQLLLANLVLLAPYIPKLFRFFYALQPVSLAERQYTFSRGWKKYVLVALLLAPAWMVFVDVERTVAFYQKNDAIRKQQKLYEVTMFVKGKDTLLPLVTDTLRWSRFAISDYQGTRFGVVYNMKGVDDWYYYRSDTINKMITLTDNADANRKFQFGYSDPEKDKLFIRGEWKGEKVQMLLSKVEIDSLPLAKEKIKWVQDY